MTKLILTNHISVICLVLLTVLCGCSPHPEKTNRNAQNAGLEELIDTIESCKPVAVRIQQNDDKWKRSERFVGNAETYGRSKPDHAILEIQIESREYGKDFDSPLDALESRTYGSQNDSMIVKLRWKSDKWHPTNTYQEWPIEEEWFEKRLEADVSRGLIKSFQTYTPSR